MVKPTEARTLTTEQSDLPQVSLSFITSAMVLKFVGGKVLQPVSGILVFISLYFALFFFSWPHKNIVSGPYSRSWSKTTEQLAVVFSPVCLVYYFVT